MLPELLTTFGGIETFIAENPELATVNQSAGQYSVQIEGNHPELFPNVTIIAAATGVVVAAMIALLAAAVTRRLHDRGLSGIGGPRTGASRFLRPGRLRHAFQAGYER